jgi:hypothetical protein
MKRKCHDKKHKQYYLHGEKGFRFCIDWMKFDSFYMWFKLNRVGLKDTFIIKNEFKIYSPQNCTVLPLTEKRRIYEKKRSKFKLKIGQKFGNLIVVNDLENCRYRCQCDCKNFITSYAYPLISGKIKNCKKCKYGMKYAWSRNYPECIKCHSMKNPYGSKGICRKCYEKEQTQYFWREELLFLLKNRILYLEKLN